MTFKEKYTITPRYLTSGSKRRSGRPMSPGPLFVVAHDTGNAGSTAAQNVRYYENSRNEQSASAHIFVDDREIVECIPALTGTNPEKAWHVLYGLEKDNQLFGHNANDAAIGVEYCFGDRIDADEAYRKYVWVIARACFAFQMDPHTRVVGHCVLDPKRKTDPVTGLLRSNRTYEQLLRDVVAEYEECTGTAPSPALPPAQGGEVIATVRLNVRAGAPSTRAPIHETVAVGTRLKYVAVRTDGDAVAGNRTWMKTPAGNWFWSGGARAV